MMQHDPVSVRADLKEAKAAALSCQRQDSCGCCGLWSIQRPLASSDRVLFVLGGASCPANTQADSTLRPALHEEEEAEAFSPLRRAAVIYAKSTTITINIHDGFF